jgi:hypothetical protein
MNSTTFEQQYRELHDGFAVAMIHDRLSHPADHGFEQDDAGAGHCLLVAERIATLKAADTRDAEILAYLRVSEVDPFDVNSGPGTGILAAVSYLNALLEEVEDRR